MAELRTIEVSNKFSLKNLENIEIYKKSLKRFIALFILILLFASSIVFANTAPRQITREFNILFESQEKQIDTSSLGISLQKVSIVDLNKENGVMKISYMQNRPIDRFLIGRSAYQYFSVEKKQKNDDLSIELEFRISDEWMNAQNIQENAITLYKFDFYKNQWTELSTNYKYENRGYKYFTAKSEGYGYFVISDKDLETKIIKEQEVFEQKENEKEEQKYIQEPQLEMPLELEKESNLIPFIAGIILFATLIGSGVFVTDKVKKEVKEKEKIKQDKKRKALEVLNSIEQRVLSRHEKAKKLKSEIEYLEPLIAKKFAEKMKNEGYSPETIKSTLIQNQIDEKYLEGII